MRKTVMVLGFLSSFFSGRAQGTDYAKYPVYTETDLGLTYSPAKSTFRIWAPTASKAELLMYHTGTGHFQASSYPMQKSKNGTWDVTVYTDQKGKYYAFRVFINGKWSDEVPDPYARAVGINGERAMVVDKNDTDPPGWEQDRSPAPIPATDAIIYELQIRDATIDSSSGSRHKGKFLGLAESGTTNTAGLATGIDHLKELGITHVHLMPFFDFRSVDETKPDSTYNWGYDPLNYNVPEGSFATNAYDGAIRIREFKTLVKALHDNGIRVVMDVVYNHTALSARSNFNQLAPGYYYRQTRDGKWSNATACGNETASERPMFRKFMLESMKYWVQEYHIDGFRIDLMGVHDISTLNLLSKELQAIKPGILLYGEGWTAGSSPLPDAERALKANVSKLDHIAVFSDDFRDAIKGSVFQLSDRGFATGRQTPAIVESVKFGVTAACPHPQVDYTKILHASGAYATAPGQIISYSSCHDNHCLWDKITLSATDVSDRDRENMDKLALSMVLTAQGIPFLHAGDEFLRSKKGVENSYQSPDSINAINWNLKTIHKPVFDYVKGLIAIRKNHPAFRIPSAAGIASAIVFRDNVPAGVISFTIDGSAVNDSWKTIQVFYNGSGTAQPVTVPSRWKIAVLSNSITTLGEDPIGTIELGPYSCTILYQQY